MNKPKTLTELKHELDSLTSHYALTSHPDVLVVVERLRNKNAARVKELRAEIDKLQNERKPVLRWPENTPGHILERCKAYWSGTTEYQSFRIHLWNDKAVWTSYPAGGYSTNGGWNPTPACYYCISLSEVESSKPRQLKELGFERNSGKRVTPKMMQEFLDTL